MRAIRLTFMALLLYNSTAFAATIFVFSENFARFDAVSGSGSVLHYNNSSSNGGFSDWIVNDVEILNRELGSLTPLNSNNGTTDYVSLGLNASASSSISRSINTFVGSTYTVVFHAGSYAAQSPFTVRFGSNSSTLASNSNYGTNSFIPQKRLEFLATSALTTVSFSGAPGFGGVVLDNISVFTNNAPDPINNGVPLPSALLLLATGLAIFKVTRSKSITH
jgi:hypothetical protein